MRRAAYHPLRGQNVPARGGSFHGWRLPGLRHRHTSVLLAAGSGADAVIAPEMLAFARTLGFRFRAHRVGHPDRKAESKDPLRMSKTISWLLATSRISTI
jgi:hypothetical protein